MYFVTIAAFALGLIAGDPQARPDPGGAQDLPITDLGDTDIVIGQGRRDRVRSFIREVSAPPPGRVLARWDRAICIGAANLQSERAQFLIDRVALRAVELGLEVDGPGCRPNIVVIAALDAGDVARALVEDDPISFRPSLTATDRGERALARFQSTDAPVRWWHVSLPVVADTGEIAVSLRGEPVLVNGRPEPLTVRVRDASRLRSNTRDDLARVVIIIDAAKVGPVGFGALSDYVAMIALAQIDADADTSAYDSVLNMFAEGADRSAGLTPWDRDYLSSLYTTRRDRIRASQQAEDIVREMTGDRR